MMAKDVTEGTFGFFSLGMLDIALLYVPCDVEALVTLMACNYNGLNYWGNRLR